jgi:hypothetical protein
MAAKFDASQTLETTPTSEPVAATKERPAHIPEKFWDAEKGEVRVEALAKSYSELEKSRNGKGQEQPSSPGEAKEAEEVTTKEASEASPDQAKETVESLGLDFDAMSARFAERGELDAEDRKALNAKGIPDSLIDAFIQGQVAQADQFTNSIYETVGGKEEYSKLVQWAQKGLSKEDQAAYNKVMDGNDPAAIKFAVQGLKSKFEAAYGHDPKFVQATASNGAGDVFRSSAELQVAMSDPRYASDPAYRNDVIQKLNRSSIF